MESLTNSHLLEWPKNAVYEIRKQHNLHQPERLEEALNIIEKWIQKQDHFVKKDFDRNYIERTLIHSKGSVEKTKRRIDRLCTMKTLLPHFFMKTNVKLEMTNALELACLIPLPVMTNDYCRIFLIQFTAQHFTEKSFLEYYQYAIAMCEYLKARDYPNGYILIEDFRKINMFDVVTKMNTVELQQFMMILLEGFGARIKSIHMVTESKAMEILMKIIRRFLSEKIANRVIVHKNLEELHEMLPKELLPLEYGGELKSIDEFNVDWQNELSSEEHIEYLKMMKKACTNENLRNTDKFNEEYMGMPGAFRNLSVD